MQTIKVQGRKIDPVRVESTEDDIQYSDLVSITTEHIVQVEHTRSLDNNTLSFDNIEDDHIIELEFEGGLVQWLRADELAQRLHVQPSNTRSYNPASTSQALLLTPYSFVSPEHQESAERGILDVAGKYISEILKFVKILNINPSEELANLGTEVVIDHYERRRIPKQGLLHYQGNGLGDLVYKAPDDTLNIDTDKPVLLFIHGMFTNSQESFGDFPDDELAQLTAPYGDQVYFLEHRTLTQSPMANALLVTAYFPKNTVFHLVTHSRGGLVGEFLCQCDMHRSIDGQFLPSHDIFNETELQTFKADKDRKKQYQELVDLQKQLQDKHYKVEKFIRVAAPMRGTLLVANNLEKGAEVIFNVLSLIPNVKYQAVLQFIRLVTLAMIKKRTLPAKLPGMECMMPRSPVIRILNRPAVHLVNDLTVISSELRPDSWFHKAIEWMVRKVFFHEPHDLAVNTAAMLGGCQRVDNTGRQLLQIDDNEVHHFEYFASPGILPFIRKGLTLAAGEIEKPFLPIWESDDSRDDTTDNRPPVEANYRTRGAIEHDDHYDAIRSATRDVPLNNLYLYNEALDNNAHSLVSQKQQTLLFIPGLFGSALAVKGKSVWLNTDALSWGEMNRLNYDTDEVTASGLVNGTYQTLLDSLASGYQLVPFAWDWRKSHMHASHELAKHIKQLLDSDNHETDSNDNPKTLRILAHSNGAYVVLGMIAKYPELWQQLCENSQFRVIFMGSPLNGSHRIVQLLLGQHRITQLLNMLSQEVDTKAILRQFSQFTGILELLPSVDDYDYFSADFWQYADKALSKSAANTALNNSDPDRVTPPSLPIATKLEVARKFHNLIHGLDLRNAPISYIQGQAQATPHALDILDDRVLIHTTNEGDGFTTWPSVWQQSSINSQHIWHLAVEHGRLLNHPKALISLVELFEHGFSNTLKRASDVSVYRRRGFVNPSPVLYPNREELMATAFHYSLGQQQADTQPYIHVSVMHGNLEHVNTPVVAGHYLGDSINSAEAALDNRLDGRLRELYHLGMYPGDLNTSNTLFSPNNKPSGAIIVGLGSIGELSPNKLTETYMRALINYALKARYQISSELKHADNPDDPEHYQLDITSLLIGSSTGGLNVQESIMSILRAFIRANQQLRKDKRSEKLFFSSITFVELYEDRAIEATHLLKSLKNHHEFVEHIDASPVMNLCPGHLKRVTYEQHSLAWSRIQVIAEANNALKYTTPSNRAGAKLSLQSTQRNLVDQFIKTAMSSSHDQRDIGKTLFELLIPNELKDPTYDINKLVMVLDGTSANYPWELLENRRDVDKKPMSVRSGMLRQLQTSSYRRHIINPSERNALVIGNPQSTGFSNLPSAESEALSVSEQLTRHGFSVNSEIHSPDNRRDTSAQSILTALHTNDYRILHLAGHGVYQYDNQGQYSKPITGMVLGDNIFLTPTEISQMRTVPDFAFINCCHLGKAVSDPSSSQENRYALAANLATELIKMGVRAVIAAGWAIDDHAAQRFAYVIYQTLLGGETFGEAVIQARRAVYREYPKTNTWGAYQCYGDPDYVITQGGYNQPIEDHKTYLAEPALFVSKSEVLTALQNLVRITESSDNDSAEKSIKKANEMLSSVSKDWIKSSQIQYELARLYHAAGDFKTALTHYSALLNQSGGEYPLTALDSMIRLYAYQAIEQYREVPDQQAILILEEAEKRLYLMLELGVSLPYSQAPLYIAQCKALMAKDQQSRIESLNDLADTAKTIHFAHLKNEESIDLEALIVWLNSQTLLDLFLGSDEDSHELLNASNPASVNYWLSQANMRIDHAEQYKADFNSACRRAEYQLLKLLQADSSTAYKLSLSVISNYRLAKDKGSCPADIKTMGHHCNFIIDMLNHLVNIENENQADIRAKRRIIKDISLRIEQLD